MEWMVEVMIKKIKVDKKTEDWCEANSMIPRLKEGDIVPVIETDDGDQMILCFIKVGNA